MGRSIEEVERLTGGRPVIGYLSTETLLADGATWSAEGTAELRAETELALRVGGGFAVALELVDVGPTWAWRIEPATRSSPPPAAR